MILLLGSVISYCEEVLSQNPYSRTIIMHPGRQLIVVPQETKDYILSLFQEGFWHRDLITSGQMDISYRFVTIGKGGKVENESSYETFVTFDEERHRVDQRHTQRYNPDAGGTNIPHVSVGCIGCYEGNNQLLVTYSQYENPNKPDERSWLIVNDKGQQFEGREWSNMWTTRLGFIPKYIVYFNGARPEYRFPIQEVLDEAWYLLHGKSIRSLDSGVTEVNITDEDYKGTECKKIVLEIKWDDGFITRNSLWFAVNQGYALRKQHFQESVYDDLLEVDVALDEESGIWFPSSWRYERKHSSDGSPRFSEAGTIKNVVLNKPIPDKFFTMQELKTIPAGVPVAWHAKQVPPPHGAQRGELLWDGTDIITRGMYSQNMLAQMIEKSKSERAARITKVLLINAIAIGIIVAIVSLRYYLRLKQQNVTDD